MDERIRELRNLAWKEIYGVDPDDPRVARAHAHMEEGMAKFAELIIKECIAVANYYSDGHVKDQFGRKMYQYRADIGKQIADCFGVEE